MKAGAQDGRVDVVRALRDAAFIGVIAFALFLPLIGFETTVNGSNQLILTTRWPLLAAIVVISAAGRFLYSFVVVEKPGAPEVAARAFEI